MYLWKYTENRNFPGVHLTASPQSLSDLCCKLWKYGKCSVLLDNTTKEVSSVACERSAFRGFKRLKLEVTAVSSSREDGDDFLLDFSLDDLSSFENAICDYADGLNDFSYRTEGVSIWFW